LLGYTALGKIFLENASLTISKYFINMHDFEQKVTVVFQKVIKEHLLQLQLPVTLLSLNCLSVKFVAPLYKRFASR